LASKDLTVIENPDDAIEAIRGNLVVKVDDPAEVSRRMMEAIFDSEDVDSILGRSIAIHAQDIIGRPFTLTGIRYMKSRFDQGLPVFAVMDAEFLDDGSTGSITCSARNVCAQAAMLWKLEALPKAVKIMRTENPTADGYFPLFLEAA
jgi:hypothetical protein